jgi:hypothetical protein
MKLKGLRAELLLTGMGPAGMRPTGMGREVRASGRWSGEKSGRAIRFFKVSHPETEPDFKRPERSRCCLLLSLLYGGLSSARDRPHNIAAKMPFTQRST